MVRTTILLSHNLVVLTGLSWVVLRFHATAGAAVMRVLYWAGKSKMSHGINTHVSEAP